MQLGTEGECHDCCLNNAEKEYPPPPLPSKRPCIVSGGAGGEGTVTFRFVNLLRRSDIELLLCVCWLDKVVLLVHGYVLRVSGIQGTPLYPASCRTLQCLAISATDSISNVLRASGGRVPQSAVLITGPSHISHMSAVALW